MSFYTSVVKVGNALFHRYIENGERKEQIINHFDYELFLQSEYSRDSVEVYGNSLKRYEFSTIADMNQFIQEIGKHNVYGNTDPVSQFISKAYPDEIKLTNDYVVLNFDIETEHGSGKEKYKGLHKVRGRYENTTQEFDLLLGEVKDHKIPLELFDEEYKEWKKYEDSCYAPKSLGFPDPNLAKYEVLSVSLIDSRKDVIYVYGIKEYNGTKVLENEGFTIQYIHCNDEKELLVRFIQKWRSIKPDIVTGWNVDGFDIPYIINRIVRVLGKKYANMLSPCSAFYNNCIREKQVEDRVYYSIAGINIYDYLDIYKKFSRDKQESYKLDWIGKVEVGHQKISYDEFDNNLMKLWEYGYDKFVLYNAIDTLIVTKLDRKLKFINLAITISHITKSDLGDATGTIKPWDNTIYNLLGRRGVQIPPAVKKEKTKEFMGAYVKEPLYGRHGWTITVDATSLYPMIIIGYGMSPETLRIREVGSSTYAVPNEVQQSTVNNLNYINNLIETNNRDIIVMNEDMTDYIKIDREYVTSELRKLDNAPVEYLKKLKDSIRTEYEYNDSGHPYIKGTKSVADNIVNTINMETDLSWSKELNYTVAGNGSAYDKSVKGVIPEAMTFLFNYRKSLKTQMKKQKSSLQGKIEELHKLEQQLAELRGQ